MSLDRTINRVIVQQPALPKFRIPVFKLLSEDNKIDLLVYYSSNDPSLPNVEPYGFNAVFSKLYKLRVTKSRYLLWHHPQWAFATRSETDVLILSWDLHYMSLVPSLLRAKYNKVPVILWGHGYSKNDSKIRSLLRRLVGKLATALLFYDFNTANTFIRSKFPHEKIFIAPNTLSQNEILHSINYWKSNTGLLKKFQQVNNINTNRTIIYIGRVYPENRLDELVNALALIASDFTSVKLIIIGKGELEETRLKKLASSVGVSDKIIWAGALYNEKEIAKWMLSATVFCYPENMGLSIMHAFGYGLPVITSNNVASHNPEIFAFRDQINGLFYESGSYRNLAEVIRTAFMNPKKILLLSKEAHRTVYEKFSLESMVSGFKQAIEYVSKKK